METGDLGEFIYSLFVGNARLWRGGGGGEKRGGVERVRGERGGESEEGRGVGREERGDYGH